MQEESDEDTIGRNRRTSRVLTWIAVIVVVALAGAWQQGLLLSGLLDDGRDEIVGTAEARGDRIADFGPFGEPPPVSIAISGSSLGTQDPPGRLASTAASPSQTPVPYPTDVERGRILAELDGIMIQAGSTVGVEPGDIRIERVDQPEIVPSPDAVLGQAFQIETDVRPSGKFLLTLDTSSEPSAQHIPGVWRVDEQGRGILIPGYWDSEEQTISVSTAEFSIFLVAWLFSDDWRNKVAEGWEWVVNAADDVFDNLTGRTDPPECSDVKPHWISVEKIEATSVHVCLQSVTSPEAQLAAQIHLRSNRSSLQVVTIPNDADAVEVQWHPDWLWPIVGDISLALDRQLAEAITGDASPALMLSGSNIKYSLYRPVSSTMLQTHVTRTAVLDLINLTLAALGLSELDSFLLVIALAVYSCVPNIINTVENFSELASNLPNYVWVSLTCLGSLLSSPDRTADGIGRLLGNVGVKGDSVAKTAEWTRSLLNVGKIAKIANTANKITSGITAAVTVWDMVVDRASLGLIEINLYGSEYIAIDYASIDESIGEVPLIVLLDTSGSMGESINDREKLQLAKDSLGEFLAVLSPTRPVALRSYPTLPGQNCNSGALRADFLATRDEVRSTISELHADGGTPTAEALLAAAEDIRQAGFDTAEIVLFSDGEPTCENPCDAAGAIKTLGIDVQVHVGAFVTSQQGRQGLRCIAEATGGTYTESSGDQTRFAEESAAFLQRNSVPSLTVAVSAPDSVIATSEVRHDDTSMQVEMHNDGNVSARDVIVHLNVRSSSASVSRAIAVGNLAPNSSTTVNVPIHAGFESVGDVLDLTVTVEAANSVDASTASASVAVDDPVAPSDSGEIFGTGRIVLMGDELLAGSTSSARRAGEDCRRSDKAGLLNLFNLRGDNSLACAHALIEHLIAPDYRRGEASQARQLRDRLDESGSVDALVLSVGAHDFGLAALSRDCILEPAPCSEEISGIPTDRWLSESIAGSGRTRARAIEQLVRAVAAISREVSTRSSALTPILLLAQPRALPFVSGACFERWRGDARPLLTQGELDLYHYYLAALNGTLEAAAETAQAIGVPAFYVDATEDAYSADHSACSAEPYVQSLEPVAEFLQGNQRPVDLHDGGISALDGIGIESLSDLSEGFLAPNAHGERALASAVIRWSQGDDAIAAVDALREGRLEAKEGVAAIVSDTSNGDPDSATIVEVSGFVPGTIVTARDEASGKMVASALAGESGDARLHISPELLQGRHAATLTFSGHGASGRYLTETQEIDLPVPGRPIAAAALPVLALLLLFGSLAAWRSARRQALQRVSR